MSFILTIVINCHCRPQFSSWFQKLLTVSGSECDVPVPGIPVPGNSSFFLMVSEPESKKFGTEKSLRTVLENFLTPVPRLFSVTKCFETGSETLFQYQIFSIPFPRLFSVSKKMKNSREREFPGPGRHTLLERGADHTAGRQSLLLD